MSKEAVLPPGVSAKDFAEAVKEYKKIVGDEWVKVALDKLAPYARLMIPAQTEEHQPSGAIAPASVEEIQAILKVSNKYKIPLWTISTGRNYGYGEAAPATPGQMVLDLKRMNRIIHVDPDLGTALVEPGVTFKQLFEYLQERDLPFWINKPMPAPIAGPVGWTLDRGQGYTRYQEQAQNFSGMEVVLADGTVVKTGMGGPENSKGWQCYRWGYGPWVDGIFTQSNYGIVTKLGIWLMKRPKETLTFLVSFDDFDAAAKSLEVIRDLRMDGIIDAGLTFHMGYGAAMTMKRSSLYSGPGAIPKALWEGMSKQTGISVWTSSATLYGTSEQIAVNLKICKDAFEKIGGKLETEHEITGPATLMKNNMKMLMTDGLSMEDFAIFNFRGRGTVWFAPVVPATAADCKACLAILESILNEYGFDYFGGFMSGYSGRNFDGATILLYDRDNPEETQRAKECYRKIIDETAKAGYPVYRAATSEMARLATHFGKERQSLNDRLKEALDPNHILAPGKSGIF